MKLTRCKCGKNIIFAKVVKRDGTEGKVPLDPSAPVYYVNVDVDSEECTAERAPSTNASGYYVSHFCTCALANEFSWGQPMSAITARIGRFIVSDQMKGFIPRIGTACQIFRVVHDDTRARSEVFATSDDFDLVDIAGEAPLYECRWDGLKFWFKRQKT